jgi:UDP-glucose 4-epimerase
MHALVTGSSGFIGRHLCDSLLKLGHKVSPFCRSQGGDILQWGDVRQWVVPDVVYHLAGMLSTASPRDIYEVNVLGTLNLLEFCRLHKVRQLVYASSYLYGLPNYLPVDEGHPLNGERLC